MSNKPNLEITYNSNAESTVLDDVVTKVMAVLVFPLPLLTVLSLSFGQ